MPRATSIQLDRLLEQQLPAGPGFVRVVDYMGNDSSIVQAARISYGTGEKSPKEDRNLIRFLMRHRHTSPFEMCEIKLHVRVPMDTWRQWIRHRTANVNEYSTRYTEAIDATATVEFSQWRKQASSNKQGSAGTVPHDVGTLLTVEQRNLHKLASETYQTRLKHGVAREQARMDLPLSTLTEAYWKIDLHNLLHFLELRMDSHAQAEIREYATVIGEQIVKPWVPATWEAFCDYRLDSVTLNRKEQSIVKLMLDDFDESGPEGRIINSLGKRERAEVMEKLRKIAFS